MWRFDEVDAPAYGGGGELDLREVLVDARHPAFRLAPALGHAVERPLEARQEGRTECVGISHDLLGLTGVMRSGCDSASLPERGRCGHGCYSAAIGTGSRCGLAA